MGVTCGGQHAFIRSKHTDGAAAALGIKAVGDFELGG